MSDVLSFHKTLPISSLSEDHPFLEPSDLRQSLGMLDSDSVGCMLGSLSILELTLVIAMNHITHLNEHEGFNFEMVYNG